MDCSQRHRPMVLAYPRHEAQPQLNALWPRGLHVCGQGLQRGLDRLQHDRRRDVFANAHGCRGHDNRYQGGGPAPRPSRGRDRTRLRDGPSAALRGQDPLRVRPAQRRAEVPGGPGR
eukprot:scaffold72755_cov92-Phaeocystis_antarctica.AAC.2